MWGPSSKMPATAVTQRELNIDGSAGTAMYQFNGDLGEIAVSVASRRPAAGTTAEREDR